MASMTQAFMGSSTTLSVHSSALFSASKQADIDSSPRFLSNCYDKQLENGLSIDQASSHGALLQWSLLSETRRSFLTGFLQQLVSPFVDRCSPAQIHAKVNMQLLKAYVWSILCRCTNDVLEPIKLFMPVKIARPDMFARRIALLIPFLVTSCNDVTAVTRAEDSSYSGSFLQNFGFGDGDIYYPRIFEGSWICKSTLVAIDTPQGEDKADPKSIEFARKQLGYTVTYKAHFIPFENHIIGDRLFTTLSLVESSVGKDVVDHGIWTPQQPDRLTLVLRGGAKVQNVVTKRSATLSGPGQFDTSEYSQQIFDNPRFENGQPTIKASQNRTRYRWDATVGEVPYIEAFQRVSMFPVVQEGLSNLDIMGLDKPITVYKYIVRFTREVN